MQNQNGIPTSERAALIDDPDIRQKVDALWAEVFTSSNKILHHAKFYGFMGMEVIPSPNIHQILLTLRIYDSVIGVLLDNAENCDLEHDELRLLFNAKQQILRMEAVAIALKIGDRGAFDLAIKQIEHQAPF